MSHHKTKIPTDPKYQEFDLGCMLLSMNEWLTKSDRMNRNYYQWITGSRLFNDLMDTIEVNNYLHFTIQFRPIFKNKWKYVIIKSSFNKYNKKWQDTYIIDRCISDINDPWILGKELYNLYNWKQWYLIIFNILWDRLEYNPKLPTKRRIEFQIPFKNK